MQTILSDKYSIDLSLSLLASNTLDPMNLTRSESRNTMGPSFKLQIDGVFTHGSTLDNEKQKITDQVCSFFLSPVYGRISFDLH